MYFILELNLREPDYNNQEEEINTFISILLV